MTRPSVYPLTTVSPYRLGTCKICKIRFDRRRLLPGAPYFNQLGEQVASNLCRTHYLANLALLAQARREKKKLKEKSDA